MRLENETDCRHGEFGDLQEFLEHVAYVLDVAKRMMRRVTLMTFAAYGSIPAVWRTPAWEEGLLQQPTDDG